MRLAMHVHHATGTCRDMPETHAGTCSCCETARSRPNGRISTCNGMDLRRIPLHVDMRQLGREWLIRMGPVSQITVRPVSYCVLSRRMHSPNVIRVSTSDAQSCQMHSHEEWSTLYVYCLITLYINDSFLDNSELIDPYLGSIEDSFLSTPFPSQRTHIHVQRNGQGRILARQIRYGRTLHGEPIQIRPLNLYLFSRKLSTTSHNHIEAINNLHHMIYNREQNEEDGHTSACDNYPVIL